MDSNNPVNPVSMSVTNIHTGTVVSVSLVGNPADCFAWLSHIVRELTDKKKNKKEDKKYLV